MISSLELIIDKARLIKTRAVHAQNQNSNYAQNQHGIAHKDIAFTHPVANDHTALLHKRRHKQQRRAQHKQIKSS